MDKREDGSYVGRLNNEPVVLVEVAYGAMVEFGPEHVIAIRRGSSPFAGSSDFSGV